MIISDEMNHAGDAPYDAMGEDLRNNIAREAAIREYGPGTALIPAESLAGVITELIRPIMESIGKMLENNTAALEQLSAAQTVQNDRLEALEKQIRLQTPVTGKQVSYLNGAIKARSRELLDKNGVDDAKAITKLGNCIRKAVLWRYGVSSMREIPKHEYTVAMYMIAIWNDVLTVRDIAKERWDACAETSANAVQPAGTDGAKTVPGEAD